MRGDKLFVDYTSMYMLFIKSFEYCDFTLIIKYKSKTSR